MGSTTVHPSQRRVSCQACRKNKSRCQKFDRNDPKCVRCTLNGAECITGLQRHIGRPRQTTASTTPPSSTVKKLATDTCSQTKPTGAYQEDAFQSKGACQANWTIVQVPDTAADDAFGPGFAAATWEAGLGSLDVYLPPLNAGFDFAYSQFTSVRDSGFGIPTPPPYTSTFCPIPSPASTTSSNHSICLTTINAREIPGPENVDSIDTSTALMELSKINFDLHIRLTAAEANNANLDFNHVIYRQGALYIDHFTLAEFMLKTSQDFLLILTRLLNTQKSNYLSCASPTADKPSPELPSMPSQAQQMSQVGPSCSLPSYHIDNAGTLPAPVALITTSIFLQLVSLFELIVEYITARVERISIDPIAPIPDLMFGGVPLESSCTQGLLFSEAIIYLLERLESALGIKSGTTSSQVGVLSARQIKVLWSELDGRRSIIPGHAIMRPSTLRRLFGRLAAIFRRLSVDPLKT